MTEDRINILYMRKILFICITGLFFYSLMPINAVFSETEVKLKFDKYFTVGQHIEIPQEPAEKDPHRSEKPLNDNVAAPFMEQESSLPDTLHQDTNKSGSDNGEEIYGPSEIPVLKKIEIDRIGAAAAYETFEGLRFGKYFTVSQRIEIYQEARPIDSYILDTKAMRILGQDAKSIPWDKAVNFRSQIVPQFTRAYGTEFTISDPDDKEGQIRYVHDYRDIYKQYYPKYAHMGAERWHQHEIFLIHSRKIPGINWYYTSNLGFRYSTINIKSDDSGDELPRMTYMASLALAPSARLEWFGKFEYYKSKRMRSDYHYSPDHWYYRTELRMKSADFKTSVIPAFSYSVDYYF
ncbi:MAG: hypothetical protein KAU58_01845, partial [Candidatus Omnitrophica bacterium]|nr:hypothetical protein [Candidatus Omnitrophota bacterium]